MVLVFRDLEEHVATILQDPIDLRDDSLDVPDKGMVYDPCRKDRVEEHAPVWQRF